MLAKLQSGISANVVQALSPAAWYRNDVGVTQTGSGVSSWADQSGNGRDLLQGTDANRPINLPFTGTRYVYLPGVASNTVTSGNKSVTGNQTITLNIALNDYTPAADVTIADKSSGNSGLTLKWLTTDKLRLVIGDGATLTNVDTSVASGLTDGTQHTIVITWTDGVGASFTLDGAAWGTPVAAAKTLANAAVSFTLGSTTSIGKVYSVTVGSVYSLVAQDATDLAASWVSTTGETWTVNTSGSKPAQVVGRSSILFDGTAHYLKTNAFTLNQPESVYLLFRQVSWTANEKFYDGNTAATMFVRQVTASPQINAYAGSFTSAMNGPAIGSYGVVTAVFNGASSVLGVNLTFITGQNTGANNAGGFTLGADPTPTLYSNIQVLEAIIFPTAHDATTRARVIAYLASVGTVTL